MRGSVPYPPIERHGVIGDRRTAALVAADGNLDWLCLRDYDDDPVFASLIDAQKGGQWRAGPAQVAYGQQRYLGDTAVLETAWESAEGMLALTDAMPWPGDVRRPGDEERRAVLRRLHCSTGSVACAIRLAPRDVLVPDLRFERLDGADPRGLAVRMLGRRDMPRIEFWSSRPLEFESGDTSASARFELHEGESVWMALAAGEPPSSWSIERVERLLCETVDYWEGWARRFEDQQPPRAVIRSLVTTHLLAYAPTGAMVAAPTAGLPERIGGTRNYDYRYAWIRDASLSTASLSLVGDVQSAGRYLHWLTALRSETEAPLQVAYDVHGKTRLVPRRLRAAAGYRQSRPVWFGNRAYSQRQPGSLGYLADCLELAEAHGASWKPRYAAMFQRVADYASRVWEEPDSGIWELSCHQHFVSTKVMCWVVLDRASRLARRRGGFAEVDVLRWERCAQEIHARVCDHGYSSRLGAFRQRCDRESLDAASLLIPVMGFLPATDPRVLSTLDRLGEVLGFDGFLHRFEPAQTQGEEPLPLGFFEGAFVPCTFWMALARAMARQIDRAEALLEKVEEAAGPLGLFPEEIDAASGGFRGNYPLLFSHVEHVRARVLLEAAKRSHAGASAGMSAVPVQAPHQPRDSATSRMDRR